MLWRPVSEVYQPEAPNKVVDVIPTEQYQTWGYALGYELDQDSQEVPHWGNTAIFRIHPEGMTEPVYVTKPEYTSRFMVGVWAGQGKLIRALASGAHDLVELNQGDEVVIRPGQAYSYVNTGESDLILRDVAIPAFRPGDDIDLAPFLNPNAQNGENPPRRRGASLWCSAKTVDGQTRNVILPVRFVDQIINAAGDKLSIAA